MKELNFEKRAFYGVAREALWPLISDTALVNRAIRLQAVRFDFEPRAEGGSVVSGEFRRFGITLARWTEHAFDFIRPERYRVLREYSRGPFVSLDGGVQLTSHGAGTEVLVYARIRPRNPLGWLLAKRLVGPSSTARVLELCQTFEAYLRGRSGSAFPSIESRADVRADRLDRLSQRLIEAGAESAIVDLLRSHLASAPDERVSQMRPFELADQWQVPRASVLVTCLRATTIGLLDLRWDVLCPNCRVPKAEYRTLADLELQAHCETCNITFDANFDRLVEVRFNVAQSVRETTGGLFCIGGPQNIPHVIAQTEIEPGSTIHWELAHPGATMRLRSPQHAASAIIDARADGLSSVSIALRTTGLEPSSALLASEGAALDVSNELLTRAVVALEDQFWPDTAATAAVVSTFQEFRDLFSAEVLAPGLQVGIERLTLVFTDLAGSTAMYEQIGQARAFRLVQDHFRLLEDAARLQGGAVIKTIGDAVMAAFPTTSSALKAALDMQERMAQLRSSAQLDVTCVLKIGIHAGPCLAVNLDDRLDYFGTTVNIAARVEGEARGGEIVITDDARWDPGVDETFVERALIAEPGDVALKGISRVVHIHRILPVGRSEAQRPAKASIAAARD